MQCQHSQVKSLCRKVSWICFHVKPTSANSSSTYFFHTPMQAIRNWPSIFLSECFRFAAKDISLCRFHMLISSHSSTIFAYAFCFLYQIQGNSKTYHTSSGTCLMHVWCIFDALLMHFSFFYILLILQKSTKILRKIFWISKITKLVKLLAFETYWVPPSSCN